MATLKNTDRDILWRYALGEPLSEKDSQQFRRVMDNSKGARDELRRHLSFKELITMGKAHAADPAFVDETLRRISLSRTVREPETPKGLDWRTELAAWAWRPHHVSRWAFFCFVILAMLAHHYLVRPQTITVPAGETQTIVLADRSEVTISSGSSLAVFPAYVRSVRKVVLKGEAYFNVKPGSKPFVVKTFNTLVTVKGTRFNVRAHATRFDSKTVVAVHEGLVDVAAPDIPDQIISLTHGEGTEVVGADSAPAANHPIVIEQVLAWKNGGFAFEDEPLIVVLDELARRFGLEFSASTPLLEMRFSYFNDTPASAREVLEAICESLDLQYRRTAQGYEVLPIE